MNYTLSAAQAKELIETKLSHNLGVTPEEVAAAMEAVQMPDSLERPIGDGEGRLSDILEGKEDIAEKAADRVTIERLLHTGNMQEKNVILCRYFRDKTQSETARMLGLSQVQVSRIEKRAIARLRGLLKPGAAD